MPLDPDLHVPPPPLEPAADSTRASFWEGLLVGGMVGILFTLAATLVLMAFAR